MRTEFESTDRTSQLQLGRKLLSASCALACLFLLDGLLTPAGALAQTGTVEMNFSDDSPSSWSDRLNDPFADSNAVENGDPSSFQESDFAPRETKPRTDSLTGEQPPQPPKPLTTTERFELPRLVGDERADSIEKLDSDEPVETPTFELRGQSTDDRSPQAQQTPNRANSVLQDFNDGYQLPVVADVRSPISGAPLASASQLDPGGLLRDDQNVASYQRFASHNSSYSEITGMPSAAKFKTWKAHNVYHRPTYFEDQNLELNGNRRRFQNVVSPVAFLSTIPRIPYLIGEQHPRERVYTYGQDRPGDPAPYRISRSHQDRRGRVFQTIATLGVALP